MVMQRITEKSLLLENKMVDQKSKWPKSITVDSRIVKILSESTYENFPTALREIIINSYDANASEVYIDIDLDSETLTILDDGNGMSEDEFDFFIRIAGAKREKGKSTTQSGRLIVGKFGVGFLSIFPYFKNYNIESSKQGSDKILFSSIPCYKYFSLGTLLDVSEIPIQGGTKVDKSILNESYTKITLSGLTDLAKQFFFPIKDLSHRRHTILSLQGLAKLKWRLEEELPIEYEDERFNVLIRKYSPNHTFKVFLNKELLYRRTYGNQILEINGTELPFRREYGEEILKVDDTEFKQIGRIKFQYFILTDKKAVHPYEARSIKRRNLNVGVGERTAYGLGTEVKGGRSRLQWLTGELLVIEGLNDLINVQRNEFYYDPDHESLKEFIIERLSHHSNQLEDEAEYLNEKKEQKIKNLRYIEEEEVKVNKEIKSVNQREIDLVLPNKNEQLDITVKTFEKEEERITKIIEVRGKSYIVKISKWNYNDEIYPACKIENDKLIINKSYPLFTGVKYTDVFIRFHLLLLLNLKDGTINISTYSKVVNEILDIYKDYT